MKKVFALLFVAGVFAFASCGEKKAETSADSTAAVDSTATAPAAPAADSTAADSTAADSAAVK